MGYKRFSNSAEVEETLEKVEDGRYSSRATVYSELVQIKSEWRGTHYAERAESLIKELFRDFAALDDN